MKKIITSIWFLGLIIAVPSVILIPDIFSKYKTALESSLIHQDDENYIYFEDLNGDGIKEKIICFKNNSNALSFQIYSKDGALQNQFNFDNDFFPTLNEIYFGDVNKNHFPEVYGFTMKNDSLYLGWVEPYPNNNEIKNSVFISKIGTYDNGKMKFFINQFEITDLNNDGKNEILFSIVAGYSLTPRILVLFQPQDGTFIKSKDTGVNVQGFTLNDLNNDGKLEIVASNASSYNLANEAGEPTIDDRPWLQVFDSGLHPFFKAVPFSKGLKNYLKSFVINTENNEKEIVVFQTNTTLSQEKIFNAFHFDIHGNLLDSVAIPEIGRRFESCIFQENNGFIIYNGSEVAWLTNNFNIEKQKKIPFINYLKKINPSESLITAYYGINLNKSQLILFSHSLDPLSSLTFNNEIINVELNFDTNYGPDYFLVQTNKNDYLYHIQKNNLYYLKYPLYAVVYLLSVLFIWLIQLIREKQLNERFELKNQLREMELKSLNGQMNPHFMFNSFTTVASMLKKGEQKNAYDVFMKFTKLVRSNFEYTDQFVRPLKDELFVVTSFLEINKLRFKDKLIYQVNIDDAVSQNMLVPKMMLQIHVENAIKHGIARLSKPGILRIDIYREENFVRFTIEDNGIGRQGAKALKTSGTRKGLHMLEAVYERLNKTNSKKITQYFVDLLDETGEPLGTKVEINVPVDLKE